MLPLFHSRRKQRALDFRRENQIKWNRSNSQRSIDEETIISLVSSMDGSGPLFPDVIEEAPSTQTTTNKEECNPHQNRTVTFRIDEKTGNLDNDVFHFDARLQRKLKKELYYSGSDFNFCISEVRVLIDRIDDQCPDVNLLLNHLRNNSHLMAQGLNDDDRAMLKAWSNSEGRGLEEYLGSKVQVRRKRASQRILKFQSRMKSTGNESSTRALAERAAMESQSAASFAALVALGDALLVQESEQRRISSTAQRRNSSTAPRRNSATAPRRNSTTAPRRNSTQRRQSRRSSKTDIAV